MISFCTLRALRGRRLGSEGKAMRRQRRIWLAVVMALLVSAPVWAARPFGVFDGKVGGGNSASGELPLAGWALDDGGIRAVDIYVDGVIAGRSQYGLSRPDVAATFPGFEGAEHSGFGLILDTTHYLNGVHSVSAEAISQQGERRTLGALQFQFFNSSQNLRPFGEINFPNKNAELFGNCDLNDPNRRYSVVSGWALDSGIEANDTGVGYVELLIDGSFFANTRVDCFFADETGGLTDCYGLRRFDVERGYPHLKDAPLSGFRFVLDIGFLINFGYVPGHHVLTIRAGDKANQAGNLAEIPVTFSCDDFIGNEGSFGFIESPRPGPPVGGTVPVFGWALDREGVAAVRVQVDGTLVGTAGFGIDRPDVNAQFPGFPDSMSPGWSFELNTTALANGTHEVQVVVEDNFGVVTLIGERSFEVNNP